MCIICIEIARGRMTAEEARRNVREILLPEDHLDEIHRRLEFADVDANDQAVIDLAKSEEIVEPNARGIDRKRFGY